LSEQGVLKAIFSTIGLQSKLLIIKTREEGQEKIFSSFSFTGR